MASTRNDERSVTRTYRAAIRLGEDFITLEETITLPIDASDEEVHQAVDLGWRIYRAQREALDGQVAAVREGQAALFTPITVRDPDAPASDKQRNYISALQEDLSWSNEQLTTYASEHNVDLVTMTKGQASTFIDNLKKMAEERTRYAESGRARPQSHDEAPAAAPAPITERQHRALLKLAQDRGVDLDAETAQRFGAVSNAISSDQASTLLTEWQRAARNGSTRRPVAESAL